MKGNRKNRRGCPTMRSALELSNLILHVVGLPQEIQSSGAYEPGTTPKRVRGISMIVSTTRARYISYTNTVTHAPPQVHRPVTKSSSHPTITYARYDRPSHPPPSLLPVYPSHSACAYTPSKTAPQPASPDCACNTNVSPASYPVPDPTAPSQAPP
jgi:hypothetical protein